MHAYSEGCSRLLAEIGSVQSLCACGTYAPFREMSLRSFFAAHIGGWMLVLTFLYEWVELEGAEETYVQLNNHHCGHNSDKCYTSKRNNSGTATMHPARM